MEKINNESKSKRPIFSKENKDRCKVFTRMVKFFDFFTNRRMRPMRKSRKMETLMVEEVVNTPTKLPATISKSNTFHVTLKNSLGLTAKKRKVISTKKIVEKMTSKIKVPLSKSLG